MTKKKATPKQDTEAPAPDVENTTEATPAPEPLPGPVGADVACAAAFPYQSAQDPAEDK